MKTGNSTWAGLSRKLQQFQYAAIGSLIDARSKCTLRARHQSILQNTEIMDKKINT